MNWYIAAGLLILLNALAVLFNRGAHKDPTPNQDE